MGANEKKGYRFKPEYSVIEQNGAIHVYKNGDYRRSTFHFFRKKP